MTNRTDATATAEADLLMQQLHELKDSPILKLGEAALRFGAMTLAVIRRLENRISQLEDVIDAQAVAHLTSDEQLEELIPATVVVQFAA